MKSYGQKKYYVLSKSHKEYLRIREYLKGNELDASFLKEKIQKIKDMNESRKDFSNAVLHVWGYLKKDASAIEKQELFDRLNEYMEERSGQTVVIDYVNTLLKKYPNEYLEKSTFLTGEYYETMA
ncbi:PF08349 family protein [Lachnoanaerobaculum sp. MSX33]|uniref:YbgA family protein n=2 Tax=unclassified Lachnoanaerobaculum TaxID=2625085 RepID=UPI0003DFAAAD|nr:YbgA family protein [Lachnoanaerobaculum sp. MSX33]ETO95072.1 PF08349 family protein [Lachnoanaerobaculum sp. MSX33]